MLQSLNDAILSVTSHRVPVHVHQQVQACSEVATTIAMLDRPILSSTIVEEFLVASPVVSKLEDLIQKKI